MSQLIAIEYGGFKNRFALIFHTSETNNFKVVPKTSRAPSFLQISKTIIYEIKHTLAIVNSFVIYWDIFKEIPKTLPLSSFPTESIKAIKIMSLFNLQELEFLFSNTPTRWDNVYAL